MRPRFLLHLPLLLLLAARPWAAAAEPIVLRFPERGQVAISLSHELDHAFDLTSRWLADQPASDTPLPDPAAYWTNGLPSSIADAWPLMGLLGDWPLPPDAPPRYQAAAALALALDHIGEEWVFLREGEPPLDWRKALIHLLVTEQRVSPAGDGYWHDESPSDLAATVSALQALVLAANVAPAVL